MSIHPTAVIDSRAEIDPSAEIGPYVVIEGPVRIGARTRVGAHAVLLGHTTLGEDNVIHSGAVIGDLPQDAAYAGGESFVEIGRGNVIREHVQIHRGTKPGSRTRIGDGNFFMTNAHVAHNCTIGNRVIVATGAALGGYVEVEDGAFISGNCVVHQYVRVGKLALLRGLSRTSRDVPPFCIMDGTHTVRALNRVGLVRAGYAREQIRALHRAFVHLFARRGNLNVRMQQLESQELTEEVRYLLAFIRSSKRGVCVGPKQAAEATAD